MLLGADRNALGSALQTPGERLTQSRDEGASFALNLSPECVKSDGATADPFDF